MQPFVHFILTRFNTLSPEMAVRDPAKRLSSDWLEHRFGLFERFCFPSVRAQGNQNFKWLVFYDRKTPEPFKLRLFQLADWSNFIPVDVDICDVETMCQAIRSRTPSVPCHIITTRLDNDDAIHEDLVDRLQGCFAAQDCEAVNFKYGYVLGGGKLYFWRDPGNQFISLIEKWEMFKTVYVCSHDKLNSVGPVRQVKTIRGWLTVVHEHNAYNSVFGIRWPLRALEDGFSTLLNHVSTFEGTADLRVGQVSSAFYMLGRAFQRIYEAVRERAKDAGTNR